MISAVGPSINDVTLLGGVKTFVTSCDDGGGGLRICDVTKKIIFTSSRKKILRNFKNFFTF